LNITKNAGIALLDRDPGWFRVITIEGDKVVFNEKLRYGNNVTHIPSMKLKYTEANNGTTMRNSAEIINDFDVDFPLCHIRFVMKRGNYSVSGGKVEQVYNTDKVTVCDVRVPVKAHGNAVAAICER